MHRKRHGGRGRFPIQPTIREKPKAQRLNPSPQGDKIEIHLDFAEAEVLRLVDIEGMYQEQAGKMMGVSRGTIWRLLTSARRKIALSLFEGRSLIVGFPD